MVMVVSCSIANAQTFDSMGYTWTSTAGAGFYEWDDSSFTLYGAEAADQVVTVPVAVTPGDTLSYDYFLSGVGPDEAGLGMDASVNFREGLSDAPWPDSLAAPRLIFDGKVDTMDLQDTSNNDYHGVPSLTPNTTGIHVELYFDGELTSQLRIWNEMGTPTGDPIFDSVASLIPFDLDNPIASMRVGLWNSPGQYLTFSNFTHTEGELPEGLAGDFNGDGTVNLADYTVWRDNLGSTEDGTILGGNGDGLGVVDADDYTLWKTNFGSSTGVPGSFESVAVPEPATLCLLASTIVLWGIRSTRNRCC
ncbi:hypothetical protein Pan181_32430 [Aeoliella mucimassa]|uniref:PEP-CTERM protein-sorting domain-containing protein n=2 Tax=Aeoliella mucimassa TaxID=2527972 RepID=A0A518AQN1_9BACT|nr:hypothetical protein Pan181_32430 [Aeoliella mucimassa]